MCIFTECVLFSADVSGGRTNTKEITINGSIRLRVTGYSRTYGGGENLYVEVS